MVVLTRAWPYPPGEQFVADEAPYWVRDGLEVVVMPWRAQGRPVALPPGLRVDLCLSRRSRARELRAMVDATRQSGVRAELADELRHPSAARLRTLLRTARGALLARNELRAWIARNGPIDVLYSYWFDSWTLGALLLKGHGVGRVATRVHGYDLYEERTPGGRQPLRRRLVHRLDLVLPVSRSGGRYAVSRYGIDPAVVHPAPLGVAIPDTGSPTSPTGELHLLSVASCLPVKRVDRLVDAVAILCEEHPELAVHWTHLGGGPLLAELRQRVDERIAGRAVVELPGEVAHARVAEVLATGPVDLFVNTSEHEGVPVSVMEAMAHGVPVVAPRVGALDEIVPLDGSAGRLLSAAPEPSEIAAALAGLAVDAKRDAMRQAARQVVAGSYDRDRNHSRLVDRLVSLAPAAHTPPTPVEG